MIDLYKTVHEKLEVQAFRKALIEFGEIITVAFDVATQGQNEKYLNIRERLENARQKKQPSSLIKELYIKYRKIKSSMMDLNGKWNHNARIVTAFLERNGVKHQNILPHSTAAILSRVANNGGREVSNELFKENNINFRITSSPILKTAEKTVDIAVPSESIAIGNTDRLLSLTESIDWFHWALTMICDSPYSNEYRIEIPRWIGYPPIRKDFACFIFNLMTGGVAFYVGAAKFGFRKENRTIFSTVSNVKSPPINTFGRDDHIFICDLAQVKHLDDIIHFNVKSKNVTVRYNWEYSLNGLEKTTFSIIPV